MIPERATVYVCAIESEKLRLQNRSAKIFFPQIKNILHFTNRQLSDIHLNWPFVNSFWTFLSFIKTNNESKTLSNFFEDQYLPVFWKYAFNYWMIICMNTIGEISFQSLKKPKIQIWSYAYMYFITNYLYILTDLYIQEFRILISTISILCVTLPSSLRSLIPQKICTTCQVIWNSCLSPSPSQLSILMMFRYKYTYNIQYSLQ